MKPRKLRNEAIDKKRKKLEEEKDKLEKQKAQNQKTLDTHQGTAASSPKGMGEDGRHKEAQFLSEDEDKEDGEKDKAGLLRCKGRAWTPLVHSMRSAEDPPISQKESFDEGRGYSDETKQQE